MFICLLECLAQLVVTTVVPGFYPDGTLSTKGDGGWDLESDLFIRGGKTKREKEEESKRDR